MKKIILAIVFVISSITMFAQNNYYWYKGQKIFLEEIQTKKFIMFNSFENISALKSSLNIKDLSVEKYNNMNVYSSLNPQGDLKIKEYKWAVIKTPSPISLKNKNEIFYEAPFYLTPEKIEAGLSNLFYVKLNKTEDVNLLENMASQNGLEILGNNKFMPLWYTLSCSKQSNGNALQMANQFYETGAFAASQPDLMTDDSPFCVNDTHFNNQWGLNNTGLHGGTSGIDINYCEARQITTGNQNVVIAVLDQGVELNHPDLTNMHPLSFDTESGTSPSQVLGNHGTACAGIIGANSDNGIGVAGIASGSPIMSISNSLAGTPNSRQRRADGINFAVNNGASVISNSWGSAIQYQIIDDAITNALTNGRNGLGCVVVFASGNDNGAVNYPANSNDDILVVGAMSPCGERKNPNSCDGENSWGGNFGAQLDISAPGVLIPTTDRQGVNGYNTSIGTAGNYTQNFNGTSSACPHVAAVAALVLSINPNLTSQEVNNIIENTAQKVGGYNYTNTSNRPNGTWNNEMGYGLIDAFGAVQAAMGQLTVEITGPVSFCNSATYTLDTSNIPSESTVSWSVTPAYLFSVTSGSGSTATIQQKTSGYSSGEGLITFNILNGGSSMTSTKEFYMGNPYVGMDLYCYDYYSTTCFLNSSGILSNFYSGEIIGLKLLGIGTLGIGFGDPNWEWEKVSGNFQFVAYGPGNGNPQ
ncbi:MAG: S8 family serine peptidase, partial [Lutibacter sp.]|nr:S8 family serine peptidase [Lutibacter sp.]